MWEKIYILYEIVHSMCGIMLDTGLLPTNAQIIRPDVNMLIKFRQLKKPLIKLEPKGSSTALVSKEGAILHLCRG